jgi:hypothetical protein
MLMALKTIHLTCAVLTFISFSVRGVWMLADSDMLQRAWVKVAPHVIDTVLLASAIGLTIQIRQYPGSEAWLTAKLPSRGPDSQSLAVCAGRVIPPKDPRHSSFERVRTVVAHEDGRAGVDKHRSTGLAQTCALTAT